MLAKYIPTRLRRVAIAASFAVVACPVFQTHAADLFESEAVPASSTQNFDHGKFGGSSGASDD
jgi:hypothetical protein